MAFWSSTESKPMRNYRWQLSITGFGDSSIVWFAKTVNVPSFDVTEVTHDYFDNKYYFPGRVTWSDVEVTLVDPASPSAARLTNDILTKAGYNITTKQGPKKTMSKSASAGALGDVILELVDVNGATLELWTLKNAFIKSAKFGDMDYTNDELRTISLTLKYDWATCAVTANSEDNEPGGTFYEAQDPPSDSSTG